MGTGEETTPAKPSKPTSSSQEMPTTPVYPDWSNHMPAYYTTGATPPPYYASTVASPTPHPYVWGGQHPLMPHYSHVPYPTMYPTGGVYAHPGLAMTPNATLANTEMDGKGTNGKDRAPTKKSKGNSGAKAGENGRSASGSGNEAASQSAESGSDGASDASEENGNQQETATTKNGRLGQVLADANVQSGASMQASVPGKPVMPVPATNLNIGMDIWNASSTAGAANLRPNPCGTSSTMVPAGMPEQWIQDERELKRQKRKQSNRESARRSRMRKQAECEELQARVHNLSEENHQLTAELQRLSEECEKLKAENDSVKEELTRLYGPEAVANLELSNHSLVEKEGVKNGES